MAQTTWDGGTQTGGSKTVIYLMEEVSVKKLLRPYGHSLGCNELILGPVAMPFIRDGKYVGVLYLTGMTFSNYDITGLRAIFDSLQNHHPERSAL